MAACLRVRCTTESLPRPSSCAWSMSYLSFSFVAPAKCSIALRRAQKGGAAGLRVKAEHMFFVEESKFGHMAAWRRDVGTPALGSPAGRPRLSMSRRAAVR
eukprot:scaffold6776_cov91-Isochrysis_galbana.AAC.1